MQKSGSVEGDVWRPRVSIIISMYNRKRKTLKVIDQLLFPSLLNNGCKDTELILLDDCSPMEEETELLVGKYLTHLKERFGDVVYSRSSVNLGFAGSYNRGISMARGKQIIIANDDLYFPRGSIGRLVGTLDGPEKFLIAGPITNANTAWSYQYCRQAPHIVEYTRQETERLEAFGQWLHHLMEGQTLKTDNLCGFCFAADAAMLRAVGGFDQRYVYALYEDTDLIQKIVKRYGKEKVVVNQAVFVNHGGIEGASGSILQHPVKMACALVVNGIRYANRWGYWTLCKRIVFGLGSQLTGKGTISETLQWMYR